MMLKKLFSENSQPSERLRSELFEAKKNARPGFFESLGAFHSGEGSRDDGVDEKECRQLARLLLP